MSILINRISIEDEDTSPQAQLIERDRKIALRDIKETCHFIPFEDQKPPYNIDLSIEENRLVFRIQNAENKDLPTLVLALKPYRRLVKDYFMIVRSYDEAIKNGNPSKIEAIDMGRRAVHNEGAELLMERLEDKIEMDMDTARRLFTLICVLHAGKAHILR